MFSLMNFFASPSPWVSSSELHLTNPRLMFALAWRVASRRFASAPQSNFPIEKFVPLPAKTKGPNSA